MKTTGQTVEGGFMVTMSEDEHKILFALQQAAQGYSWGEIFQKPADLSADLDGALKLVALWVEHRMAIVEMQAAIERAKRALGYPVQGVDNTAPTT